MTNEEHAMAQELIKFMKRFKIAGLVTTMYVIDINSFSTFRLVMPGYKEELFIEIQKGLEDVVNTSADAASERSETGYIRDDTHNSN